MFFMRDLEFELTAPLIGLLQWLGLSNQYGLSQLQDFYFWILWSKFSPLGLLASIWISVSPRSCSRKILLILNSQNQPFSSKNYLKKVRGINVAFPVSLTFNHLFLKTGWNKATAFKMIFNSNSICIDSTLPNEVIIPHPSWESINRTEFESWQMSSLLNYFFSRIDFEDVRNAFLVIKIGLRSRSIHCSTEFWSACPSGMWIVVKGFLSWLFSSLASPAASRHRTPPHRSRVRLFASLSGRQDFPFRKVSSWPDKKPHDFVLLKKWI